MNRLEGSTCGNEGGGLVEWIETCGELSNGGMRKVGRDRSEGFEVEGRGVLGNGGGGV